jgi:hypothetical protein
MPNPSGRDLPLSNEAFFKRVEAFLRWVQKPAQAEHSRLRPG